MRKILFHQLLIVVVVISILTPSGGLAFALAPGSSQDQAYAGTWSGSYTSNGGATGNLSYILSKDEKGQWRGTVKYANQEGEQTAELKSIRIAGGKLSARLDSPDGKAEITIEGTFSGNRLDGKYQVRSDNDTVEAGTWSVTKGTTPKSGK